MRSPRTVLSTITIKTSYIHSIRYCTIVTTEIEEIYKKRQILTKLMIICYSNYYESLITQQHKIPTVIHLDNSGWKYLKYIHSMCNINTTISIKKWPILYKQHCAYTSVTFYTPFYYTYLCMYVCMCGYECIFNNVLQQNGASLR